MESTAPNRRQQIAALLKRYWGFDTFRPVQEQVILSVLAGRDTLALMPTGGGKSLTYQIPGLASEGVCIVVTPLIALMKDQVDRLRKLGIRALAIHSGLSARQIDIDLDNCVYGDVKFLYVAPERLASEAFRLRVQRMNVSLLAVDEAHCISQWGYDFRPSYLRIAELRERIPGVPVLALTASATPRVADDIMEKLRFAEPHLLRSDFSRPNLSYAVRHTDDKNEQLLRIIRNVGGSGIVYVRTREGAEQVAAFLRDEGISAEYYHGGLGHAERSMRQEAWISGRTPVMVATNAFGMGIDKPDVRYVVHYTMCDSLESYYQEAGRAGRDGQRSYAVLLISSDDAGRIAKRFEADYPPLEKIRSIYEKICCYLQIAIGDGAQSSFLFNLRDFCTREHLYTGLVQNALKILSQNGYMTLLDEAANPARILFCVSRDDLYRLRVIRDDLDHMERLYARKGARPAETALATARDPLHPLEPLAAPLHGRRTAPHRRSLHLPRIVPAAPGTDPRTIRADARLRHGGNRLPQLLPGSLFRSAGTPGVRHLRPLPRPQTRRPRSAGGSLGKDRSGAAPQRRSRSPGNRRCTPIRSGTNRRAPAQIERRRQNFHTPGWKSHD